MPQLTGVDEHGAPATGSAEVNLYAADEHAMIVTSSGVYLPSGRTVTDKMPASPADLRKLISWAWNQKPPAKPHRLLQPHGGVPQVWVLGKETLEALGWLIDLPDGYEDMSATEQHEAFAQAVQDHLESGVLDAFLTEGWEIRGKDPHPGPWIRLKRGSSMVDIILEQFAWAAEKSDDKAGILGLEPEPWEDLPDTTLPDADEHPDAAAVELGRRLAACVQYLDVLPAQNGGRTGAQIADRIWNARKKRGKGLVIEEPGPLPEMVGGPGKHKDLEEAVAWTRPPQHIDLATEIVEMVALVELDQRRSYLGSTGLEFGYGTPEHVPGEKATELIGKAWSAGKPAPATVCRVTLPAGDELGAPFWLPLPHPKMEPQQRVQAWVTTRSVKGLCDPIESGGAGLDLIDLEIEQAWVWPHQARALDAWTKVLRDAGKYFEAAGDAAMDQLVKACFHMYVGRMQDASNWTAAHVAHHHQPLWRATIMADARWRNRRHAMTIYNRYGLKPLQTTTDSWVYALRPIVDAEHPDQPPAVPDLADHTGRNGQLKVDAYVDLSAGDDFWPFVDALANADTVTHVKKALAAAFKNKTPAEEDGELCHE